jgi:protein TonB
MKDPHPGASYSLPKSDRLTAIAVVAALHVMFVALLAATGTIQRLGAPSLVARLITLPTPRPAAPELPEPSLPVPHPFVPLPEIRLALPPPPQSSAIDAVSRAASTPHAASHFGAATDSGLGLDVAAAAGGGAGARGMLARFEAAVRHLVLEAKRQPALAWDRRNTCVVNYRVRISQTGALAGLSIDPCAIPEINEAARAAIRAAAPFPPPPATAGASANVSGSLIFHP